MNNIADILLKLPALTGVVVNLRQSVPNLYTLSDIMYSLQMSYYWLRQANIEQKELETSVMLSEETDEERELLIPTFSTVEESFSFLEHDLAQLGQDTWDYVDNSVMAQPIRYKVEQAYNNIMLALFSTQLATLYYGQIKRRGITQ